MNPSTKIDRLARAGGDLGESTQRRTVRARHNDPSGGIVFRVRNTWDHEAFRTYVLRSAANAGIPVDSISDLARATDGGLNRAMLSKWFRGTEQPSVASLRVLAPAIKAPLADLIVMAGRGAADELTVAGLPPLPELHPLAWELNQMLAADSPVPTEERQATTDLIDRVLERNRKYMRRRRNLA